MGRGYKGNGGNDQYEVVRAFMDGDISDVAHPCYRICNSIVENPDDAADLTQDTVLKLRDAVRRGLYDPESGKFITYACQAAKYLALSFLRRKGRRAPPISLEQGTPIGSGTITNGDGIQDDSIDTDPLGQYLGQEAAQAIKTSLSQLPTRQYTALVLWMEGNNIDDIARLMGVTDGGVKSTLSRGRESLRGKLRELHSIEV